MTHSGRLAYLGVLRFGGSDSIDFLQGQVSNDTRRLAAGESLLAACSNPQGRVAAIMRLLPHSSGIAAIVPRELVQPCLQRLKKFVLRAKVRIDDPAETLVVAGQHGTAAIEAAGLRHPGSAATYVETDGIGVSPVAPGSGRWWLVGPAAALAARGLASEADSLTERIERDWRLADIRAGLPQVYGATQGMFVAQMLNLDLIDGISFSKGCYTGQEIIARTQHLGRIKRRLARLRLPAGDWKIGQPVRVADGRAGRLTELAAAGDAFEALAVLGAGEAAAESEAASAVAAGELPLPYPVALSA